MNILSKGLAAGLIAVTLSAGAFARPAEAGNRELAIGLAIGLTALAIATHAGSPPPPPRHFAPHGPGPGPDCGWLRRKAKRTGSGYWWSRYRDCRGY